ncbi:MAG: CoA:oxalate CoA-transferase [Gammaproteobacteria bacterium]|jgi:CoA:oxalate CoA-transferase
MSTDFRPLDGVRIIEFSSSIAGPAATMILAQLGADVIKVESPQGDDGRAWPPHVGDRSIVFRQMNVGKRGMVIDLKQAEGLEVALALTDSASVVLQTMIPGVADRIGIGAAAVRARNPEAIYFDMNAFGTGPIGRVMPGYDPMVQAFTGIMAMTGHDDAPPTRCAPSLIDIGTGQWIAMGVLAAVLAKQRGQPVQTLETAMVDTGFNVVSYQATSALISGERPPRAGSGNSIAAPYQCFTASDGDLLLAAPNEKLWRLVVRALDAPALLEDSRFNNAVSRSEHREALAQALNEIFAQAAVDDWLTRLTAVGVPATRVFGLEQAVVSDIANERQTFADSEGVPLVRLPWLVDGKPVPWSSPAPTLGQHTCELLTEIGFSEARIAALLNSGAVKGGESMDCQVRANGVPRNNQSKTDGAAACGQQGARKENTLYLTAEQRRWRCAAAAQSLSATRFVD